MLPCQTSVVRVTALAPSLHGGVYLCSASSFASYCICTLSLLMQCVPERRDDHDRLLRVSTDPQEVDHRGMAWPRPYPGLPCVEDAASGCSLLTTATGQAVNSCAESSRMARATARCWRLEDGITQRVPPHATAGMCSVQRRDSRARCRTPRAGLSRAGPTWDRLALCAHSAYRCVLSGSTIGSALQIAPSLQRPTRRVGSHKSELAKRKTEHTGIWCMLRRLDPGDIPNRRDYRALQDARQRLAMFQSRWREELS